MTSPEKVKKNKISEAIEEAKVLLLKLQKRKKDIIIELAKKLEGLLERDRIATYISHHIGHDYGINRSYVFDVLQGKGYVNENRSHAVKEAKETSGPAPEDYNIKNIEYYSANYLRDVVAILHNENNNFRRIIKDLEDENSYLKKRLNEKNTKYNK